MCEMSLVFEAALNTYARSNQALFQMLILSCLWVCIERDEDPADADSTPECGLDVA